MPADLITHLEFHNFSTKSTFDYKSSCARSVGCLERKSVIQVLWAQSVSGGRPGRLWMSMGLGCPERFRGEARASVDVHWGFFASGRDKLSAVEAHGTLPVKVLFRRKSRKRRSRRRSKHTCERAFLVPPVSALIQVTSCCWRKTFGDSVRCTHDSKHFLSAAFPPSVGLYAGPVVAIPAGQFSQCVTSAVCIACTWLLCLGQS